MAAESSKKAVCPWLEADAEAEVVDTELGEFEQAIRKLFKSTDHGIALQSKRKFHKKYKNAFTGTDAVDWIVLHASCSREKAVKIGRLWEEQGDFEHVEKTQKFADDNSLYRFIGNEEKVASPDDIQKSFAMQRERVAAAVEKHRELDDQYNPNHHLLNACTVDDLPLVKYLILEEGCDIEYAFPERRAELQQKQSQMSLLLARLIKPGDTPLKVAEKYDSVNVRNYLLEEINQRKKKQKSEKGGLMDSIMGNFFGTKTSHKKSPPAPEVKLSGSIQVNRSEVNLIEVIGTGLYSTVWRAQCRGTMVAVKIPKEMTRDMSLMVPEIIQEMSSLRSPDITSLIGVCVEDDEVMLIMELMTGNLRKLLQSRLPLSLPLRLRMALDASTGMQYLHGSNVTHGDLKSSNVMYEQQGDDYVIRISDFGLAKLFSSKIKAIGTPFYTAPEVLSGGDATKESDIYSFGILLYEIVSRKQPFGNYDNYEVFKKALTSQAVRPSLPPDCPPAVAELISQCWDQSPAKRPSFSDIKTRLWDIVVDLSIPDPAGAHFWTKFVTDKEKEIFRDSISWDDFSITFCSFLDEKAVTLPADVSPDDIPNATVGQMYELCARGPAMRQVISKVLQAKNFKSFAMWAKETVTVHTNRSVYWKCFKELLLKGDSVKQVHIENFGAICTAFGPCTVVPGGDTVAGGFLDRIKKAMESGMFFGTISVKNSLNLLKGKEPGAFLIRMTPNGEFCISRINREREILHYKAFRDVKTNTYSLDQDASGEKYASLLELIEGVKMKLRLFTPCAATPFSHIFVDETETPVNYMMADY